MEEGCALRTSGAAESIWFNGAAALSRLGVSLHGIGAPIDRLEQRTLEGGTMFDLDAAHLARRFGDTAVGLCPEAVTLEITESVIVTEDSRTDEILGALKRTGVRLAIDDFGTGYSSLAYLGRLPIDVLKVDRSFISGLGGAGRDSAIVSAMVDLAHNLDLDVVAEGVETNTELEVVRRVGCDEAQGYLLGRPTPSSASPSSGPDQSQPGSTERIDASVRSHAG
jgi:predicted signal transduction protein with EAL and GGDEF domain